MGYSTLPYPGKTINRGNAPSEEEEIGPCVGTCTHPDCIETYNMAINKRCRYCGQRIGFETPFYNDGDEHPGELVHAACFRKAEGARKAEAAERPDPRAILAYGVPDGDDSKLVCVDCIDLLGVNLNDTKPYRRGEHADDTDASSCDECGKLLV